MKKITKKRVNEVWGDYFNDSYGLYVAKSYIKDDKLRHCGRRNGEAIDEAVYNGTYDLAVDLLPIIKNTDEAMYASRYRETYDTDVYKATYINDIYDAINNMIEKYNNRRTKK
jgi:hypothetical protein